MELKSAPPGGGPPQQPAALADLKFSRDARSGLERAVTDSGVEFFRKPGHPTVYLRLGDSLMCNDCGLAVDAVRVTHAIWDGPFPCSGGGRTMVTQVPYCPSCEEKPSPYGAPITISDA